MSDKQDIKSAQAKHLADLFGDQPVAKPSRQQADDHQRARAQSLRDAASRKQAALDDEEAKRLAELRQRSERGRQAAQAQAKPAEPAPQSPPPPPPATRLHELSERNDLAEAALRNMRQHMQNRPAPTPPAPTSDPVDDLLQTAPPPRDDRPQLAAPPRRRPAPPTPEELERMLRDLSQRPRPPRSGRPEGAAGVEAFPEEAPEQPPETPPEDKPEINAEKRAEIIEQLQAKESAAKAKEPVIPADQERAVEEPVEVILPAQPAKGNALESSEYFEAIEELQQAMKVHDASGQVSGINKAQKLNPDHPLSKLEE